MTKEFAIIEEMPLPEEKREELDKLMERVNELTGCAVLLIHPSTQKAVSEICTENDVDVSVWLMETVNLGLKIEYAKRELLAAGKDGMVKIHSEDQSFPQGGGGIKH